MTIIEDQAGNPEWVQKQISRILVVTRWGLIEGDFQHKKGQRVSDALNYSPEPHGFVVLTHVRVRSFTAGVSELTDGGTVMINKIEVGIVVPVQESIEESGKLAESFERGDTGVGADNGHKDGSPRGDVDAQTTMESRFWPQDRY